MTDANKTQKPVISRKRPGHHPGAREGSMNKGQTVYAAEARGAPWDDVAIYTGEIITVGASRIVIRYTGPWGPVVVRAGAAPSALLCGGAGGYQGALCIGSGREYLTPGEWGRWAPTPEEARAGLRARMLAEAEEAERRALRTRAWVAEHLP